MQVRRRKSSCKSKGVPQVQIPVATTNCVEVEPQPDVITQVTQPEVEENQWEIQVLDDQWHQILIQADNNCRGASLSSSVQIPVNLVGESMHDNVLGKF
nr:uncharacterized protein LOC109167506 [Ipomoea batatas]